MVFMATARVPFQMELRDLHALIAIAETGSLSAAARRSHLTQPALTASLKRLEQAVGLRLVTRHSRGAVLSEEGQYVLQKAYDVAQEVALITEAAQGMAQEPAGEVRIGLPTTVAGGLIPEIVPLMQRRHPQVRLHIIEAMSGALLEQLQLGRVDLAILFDMQPQAGLRFTPLLRERLNLLVPRGHPLATQSSVTLAIVAGLPLVLPGSANSIRKHIDAAAQAEGLYLNLMANVDSLPGLIGLVRSGYCTILPRYLIGGEADDGAVVLVPITQPDLEWTLHLATRRDSSRTRAVLATHEAVTEACATLARRGIWEAQLCPKMP